MLSYFTLHRGQQCTVVLLLHLSPSFTGSVIQGISEIMNQKTLTSPFSFYILLFMYPPLAESLTKFQKTLVCCCLFFVPIS